MSPAELTSCKALHYYTPYDFEAARWGNPPLCGEPPCGSIEDPYNLRAVAIYLTDGSGECGAAPDSKAAVESSANAKALNDYVTKLASLFESYAHGRATLSFDVREEDKGCGLVFGCADEA